MDVIDYDGFFPLLLQRVPEFRHTFDEDIALYGSVINHVFMGDLYEFILQSYKKHLSHTDNEGSLQVVRRALGFLEEAMGSHDERVPNLISVSFLEGLPPEDGIPGFRDFLGQRLTDELSRYE